MIPNNNISTSSTLLELCRNNDPDGWKRLMELYKKLIFYWLDIYNIESSDRDDAFQNVLITLAKSIGGYQKSKGGKFRNWLRSVVRSRAMDFHRDNKRLQAELFPDMDNRTSDDCNPAFLFDPQPSSRWEDAEDAGDAGNREDAKEGEDVSEKQLNKENYILKMELTKILEKNFQSVHIQAFFLSLNPDLSSQNIGDQLGLSPNNVRQISSRVRKYLRENYGELL